MLDHPFVGEECDCVGDGISDTPRQSTPSKGCPVGKDSCPDYPGEDNYQNYMDYSEDACLVLFTPDQEERMRFAWEAYRAPISDGVDPDDIEVADIPPADPCSGNDASQNFILELTTDDYGDETSWTIENSMREVVVESKGFLRSEKDYEFGPYCLPPGSYAFILYDSEADSICCEWGEGSFKMILDDKVIYEGPKLITPFNKTNGIERRRRLSLEVEIDGLPRVGVEQQHRRLKGTKESKVSKGSKGSKSGEAESDEAEVLCRERVEFVIEA